MQKIQYIDEIYNLVKPTSENLTKQMVEVAINAAYNQIAADSFNSFTSRKAYRDITSFDLCKKRFNSVAVTYDTTNAVYYSNYPVALVPNINLDQVVNTVQGQGTRFYPITEADILVTENLNCNKLDTYISYLPKRERVEYYNMESLDEDDIDNGDTPTPRIPTVRLELAIEFKSFESTDIVYMPNGRDYEVKQLAIDFLKQNPIMEIRNDG